jgi:heat shock protein HslJ
MWWQWTRIGPVLAIAVLALALTGCTGSAEDPHDPDPSSGLTPERTAHEDRAGADPTEPDPVEPEPTESDPVDVEPTETAPNETDLIGAEWVLESVRARETIRWSRVTLGFEDGRIRGIGGCNTFGGAYEVNGAGLRIPSIESTLMLCHDPMGVMEQEIEYYSTLSEDGLTFRIASDRLEIADAQGRTVLLFSRREPFDVTPDDLIGTSWRLLSINGAPPPEGATPGITFGDSGEFSGYTGCRGLEGLYDAHDDEIRVAYLEVTSLDCVRPEPYILLEHLFLGAITSPSNFNIIDDRLELHRQAGGLALFERLPDEATHEPANATWVLDLMVDDGEAVSAIPGTEVTVTFADGVVHLDGELTGSGGCNPYTARYSGARGLEITSIEATEMGCFEPDGVMEQEQRFFAILGQVTTYSVDGERLELSTDDGAVLVFVPDD